MLRSTCSCHQSMCPWFSLLCLAASSSALGRTSGELGNIGLLTLFSCSWLFFCGVCLGVQLFCLPSASLYGKEKIQGRWAAVVARAPPMVVFLDIHPLVWAPASGAYHLKLQAHSQVVRESSKGRTECHLLRLLPGRCQVERCFQLKQAQQP